MLINKLFLKRQMKFIAKILRENNSTFITSSIKLQFKNRYIKKFLIIVVYSYKIEVTLSLM